MRIKKFLAASLQEGKSRVIKELGDEAIVLSSRVVKRSSDGGEYYEIVAALDDAPSPRKALQLPAALSRYNKNSDLEEDSGDFLKTTGQLFDEISSIKMMISDLSENIRFKFEMKSGSLLEKLYLYLLNSGFPDDSALKLAGRILETSGNEPANIYNAALAEISNMLKSSQTLKKTEKKQVCLFVGPTGSGKTTALVKIGIICKLALEANVLIISADTHKIGGSEQLQIYASIAAIPFKSVFTPDELAEAIKENNYDFILIDTTGSSPLNREKISEISEFSSVAEADKVFLVISANASKKAVDSVIHGFSQLLPTDLIITKLDEISDAGTIVASLEKHDIPVAYFSTGQRVPDDIEPATGKKIAELLLKNFTDDFEKLSEHE